jgi:signal transduction histidine kinase
MKLYRKTFLLILATLLVTLVTSMLLANQIILGSFRNLERQSTLDNVARADAALREDLHVLDLAAKDWAQWDDAYAYVTGHNPDFAASNLLPGSFSANRLNVVVFLNATGAVVYGTGFDLATQNLTPLPEAFRHLDPSSPLLKPPSQDESVAGILQVAGHPMQVTAWPILTSQAQGPPAGTLIWGRALDAAHVNDLAQRTRLDLQMTGWAEAGGDPATAPVLAGLDHDGAAVVRTLSSRAVVADERLDGVDGRPVALLQVQLPRPIYTEGIKTLAYLLSSSVLAGGGLLTVIVVALDRAVLSRLRSLTDRVIHIGNSRLLSERVEVKGDDELGTLSAEFNRLLERLERHTNELERSNDDLRQFASVVAHDLQPPLSTFTLNVAVLREKNKGILDAEARQRLDRMDDTAQNMSKLMHAILDYSSTSFEPRPVESVDLAHVLAEAAALLDGRLQETHGELRVGPLPTVQGNPTQLLQVFQNLVGNALKHGRPGVPPHVDVSAERTADGKGWRITVSDNGEGFDPTLIPLLFRPFSRLSRDGEGYGLGLATCAKIVERHNGRIGVDTVLGKGTRFWFELPDRQPDAEPG